jgi:hypothetical protein
MDIAILKNWFLSCLKAFKVIYLIIQVFYAHWIYLHLFALISPVNRLVILSENLEERPKIVSVMLLELSLLNTLSNELVTHYLQLSKLGVIEFELLNKTLNILFDIIFRSFHNDEPLFLQIIEHILYFTLIWSNDVWKLILPWTINLLTVILHFLLRIE